MMDVYGTLYYALYCLTVGVLVGDLDRSSDGAPEVVAVGSDGVVHGWDRAGSELAGWPVTLDGKVAARAALGELDGIEIPVTAPDRSHVYHLYVIRTDRRDELRAHLKENRIATGLQYSKALPLYPAYDYLGHQPAEHETGAGRRNRHLDHSLNLYKNSKIV